jgi:4-hydroxy-3-polyprenylbenzoate decarboxylase
LAVGGPPVIPGRHQPGDSLGAFCDYYDVSHSINQFPLVVLVDDSDFVARTLDNFLWVTFTRSDPAVDIEGIGSSARQKHWGCDGALVIDARGKPHHAPPLVEDAEVTRRVDAMAARGGPLAKWL